MTGWDILNKFIGSFPPIVMALILLAVLSAVIIFIIGFNKHGVNFIKYGFKQTVLDSSLEKRFDSLEAKIEAIEVNHFGHLKNFLSELTSILLDKNIINNTDKARLDNQLRDM
jgi:VIT1/CCC1 family predicted Fe2+/Mn2+ transporter